ncbi:BglG family transcription antiterminator [Metabacillus idriensis]|uniref:BglG family transcription antiterminator n=1 Tax=Metabacillus idriensis TaxID=324768 RepID=UPI003D26EC61
MTLDQRCVGILNKIVETPRFVPTSEIMEAMNISKRTVYYDIDKINDWLKDHELEALNYVRSAGFYVSDITREQIKQKFTHPRQDQMYEHSPQERKAWAVVMILTREEPVFLQTFLDRFLVSRSTMLSDIKQIKQELSSYNLTILFKKEKGYYLSGAEQDKRSALVSYITELTDGQSLDQLLSDAKRSLIASGPASLKDFKRLTISEIHTLLNEAEQLIGVHFTDDIINQMSVHLASFIKRFAQSKFVTINPVEKQVIVQTKEFQASKSICSKIENVYQIKVPEDEVYYMTTYLLGAKISEYKREPIDDQDSLNMKKIITRMVDSFQTYACVVFKERQALEKNLFLHLKPAYYRIKYGIDLENPLTSSVQEKYQDIYLLTQKVIHHFEDVLGKQVSKDEIAYISLHFGGWIEKEGVSVQARKKAAVVCGSGIGTSRIVQKQLEDLIPTLDVIKVMTKREYHKSELGQIDYVISTTPINERDVPVFIVHPILTHAEKTNLLAQIEASPTSMPGDVEALMTIMKKHGVITDEKGLQQELIHYFKANRSTENEVRKRPMLNDILTKETIQFTNQVDSWKEAIKIGAEPLLANESIKESYIEAMINNVEKLGPYIVIAPKIALPHARPEDGVNKVGMSFLRIKEGCSFSEKTEHHVHLLFVLAAIDNETHLKALSQFSMMLSNPENILKLEQAETTDEVLSVINQYSTN